MNRFNTLEGTTMRLFTVGPVQMREDIKRSGIDIPYFRTQEFSELMLDSDRILKKLAGTNDTSKTIYLTASGTAAMEATIMNCFTPSDRLLIINGGTFGQRFVDLAHIHNIPYEEITLATGEVLNREHFIPFESTAFTALLVNIDETSTGQLYDIRLLSDFCTKKNMYLIVDAISSFLCDSYEMDKYHIDATIISSQKGTCIAPGLSMILLSERILKDRVEKSQIASLYFDFKSYLDNFTRGQTPFTPAVGICIQLNKALHLIEEIGLENHLAHIAEVADDFRRRITELPVKVPAYPLSNAITPIYFDEPIAYKVFETLKDKYDIMVNPTGGKLHDTVLRIAHIGDTTIKDNTVLIEKLKAAIADCKN